MIASNNTEQQLRTLLQGPRVTAPTRAVLEARLQRADTRMPRAFNAAAFETLRAVCGRLLPQDSSDAIVDVAGLVDDRLAEGAGKGWRYDGLPPDAELLRQGIAVIDALARERHAAAFHSLEAAQQDAVLEAVQAGTVPELLCEPIVARRFFEELLVLAVSSYYSHPLAKAAIGDASFADAAGWPMNGPDAPAASRLLTPPDL